MLTEQEQENDIIRFGKFIRQHYQALIIYGLIGASLAITITFFVPKEYKSYGIVYPPSSTSIENSIDYPNFGYDVEADRLIQIIESREIRDSVIKKFNLDKHFEVNKNAPDWHDNLVKRYFKNIKLERTNSMAVVITARTKDPELSASIVNFIINAADAFREKIYKKNLVTALDHARLEYDAQKTKVDSAETHLIASLKQSNLSSLLMLMSDAQISIDIDKLSAISTASSHAAIGAEIIGFKSMYEILKEYKSRLVKIKKTYFNPIPKIYVINYAEPSYKKVSPSFFVNACAGLIFSICVTAIVLLVKHQSER